MNSNSMFLNIITDWFNSHGLPGITEFEAMLISLAAILILLVLVWLIVRRLRLWYWKTDVQIETLNRIDARLHNVEERLLSNTPAVVENVDSQASDQEGTEQQSETVSENTEGLTAVGKSGRIYTEAELELQIRE